MSTSEKGTILLLEDERNVGSTLEERLRQEGYAVTWCRSVSEARALDVKLKVDLALLDVGLPDGSGFEVATDFRKARPNTAIIFLTAYGDSDSRVRGLELGAEDYVTKPFHYKELVLRIENGLKRSRYLEKGLGQSDALVRVGKALVSFSRFEASVDHQIHPLSQRETAVLKLLVERDGAVVSRDEILDGAWSPNEFPTSRTVDNFILRLRKIVEFDPEKPQVIRSIRGVGYQWVKS